MPINGKRWAFTKPSVDNAIDAPGVYGLYDANGNCIYYGSSETSIRTRLQRHQSGAEGPCTQSASSYNEEACSSPVAIERQLLLEYKRTYGVLPRCNSVIP